MESPIIERLCYTLIQTIFNFITEHSTELLALGALITVAYVVVRITPTKKDDKILDAILKALLS